MFTPAACFRPISVASPRLKYMLLVQDDSPPVYWAADDLVRVYLSNFPHDGPHCNVGPSFKGVCVVPPVKVKPWGPPKIPGLGW